MIKFLAGLFSFFDELAKIFREGKLIKAGEDKANLKTSEKVLKNVKKAKGAVSRLDPSKRDKLRKKYKLK